MKGKIPLPQTPVPPVPIPSSPVNQMVPPSPANKKSLKLIIIASAVALVFLLGIVVSFAAIAGQFKKVSPTPTPSAPTAQPFSLNDIQNPGRYATDAGVLKIQADLEALDKDLNSIDLNENNLRPPGIQFDESF